MGIHTALDTNGYFGERLSDAELETIDLVLLDIKALGSERHRALTGMDIGPTLDFARRLAARKRPDLGPLRARAGLTDDPEDIAQIASFAAGLGNVERVDVLPFHQMGRYKWTQARHRVHAEGRQAAVERSGRAHVRGVPRGGLESGLKTRSRL